MRTSLFVLLCASALQLGCKSKTEEKGVSDTDLKSLNGRWKVTSLEAGAKSIGARDMEYIFEDNKLTRKNPPFEELFQVKLDASKSPKTIDLTILDKNGQVVKKTYANSERPMIIQGIYELQGDTLRLCLLGGAGGDRPVNFTTNAQMPDRMVLTLQKAK